MYFDIWRNDLASLLKFYEHWRTNTKFYFIKVFIFFIFINDIAYWFAIATAYPEIFESEKEILHYSKVQIPVAFLGALFDSLSLYITLLVIRGALISLSNLSYILHLSVDILIAIAATFWVLFVFSVSGWIVSFFPEKPIIETHVPNKNLIQPESLKERNKAYTSRAINAINNPTGKEEMKNIYFGIVMGLSAIIPTCIHILCGLFSLRFLAKQNLHKRLPG